MSELVVFMADDTKKLAAIVHEFTRAMSDRGYKYMLTTLNFDGGRWHFTRGVEVFGEFKYSDILGHALHICENLSMGCEYEWCAVEGHEDFSWYKFKLESKKRKKRK